jgi:predicted secreted hydrolase
VNPRRRAWLMGLSALSGLSGLPGLPAFAATSPTQSTLGDPVRRGRPIVFPRDHGAHLGQRIEWWYATGWLRPADGDALLGFQVTFFRSRTGLAEQLQSRFAARQLLFAHAAVTDVASQRHLHADGLARWSGDETPGQRARASTKDADVALNGWTLVRSGGSGGDKGAAPLYSTSVTAEQFGIDLQLARTQPVLLQGDAGFSRKGPEEQQASHYYSEPQLVATGRITLQGQARAQRGRAWLDHEWSDELLHPQAVGWDWIGMNLDDGSALTAFRLRRADGSVLWAGGSVRQPGTDERPFGPDAVRFTPGRRWRSPVSNASYPVEWQVDTPGGRFAVRALMDAQELDSRASTGTVYWEGLSELLDSGGRRVGLGYLEMTGYAGTLRF